jgi:hypothetical protein
VTRAPDASIDNPLKCLNFIAGLLPHSAPEDAPLRQIVAAFGQAKKPEGNKPSAPAIFMTVAIVRRRRAIL